MHWLSILEMNALADARTAPSQSRPQYALVRQWMKQKNASGQHSAEKRQATNVR